jgi:hypothetical protein
MEQLWTIRAEIEVEPEDLGLDPGCTKGVYDVVSWATSGQPAETKLRAYLSAFNWRLLGVEESCPVNREPGVESDLKDLIDRATGNPDGRKTEKSLNWHILPLGPSQRRAWGSETPIPKPAGSGSHPAQR